ncbi:hypothetical protein I4U23_011361 [Adineta vaga]|nr:hypothetical protein I4U23_011361 [Adineta vaga]
MAEQSSTNCKPDVREEVIVTLKKLIEEPRKRVQIDFDRKVMATDGQYLLCFPKGKLSLIDAQGKEHLSINRDFMAIDVCWSSYLNQFLICSLDELYLFKTESENEKLIEVMKFNKKVSAATCFDQTLFVCFSHKIIEVYSMQQTNWKLLQRFDPPLTCNFDADEIIADLKFNSDGSYLAVAIGGTKNVQNQLQLRSPTDLTVLHRLDLDSGIHCLHSLPNNEYLLHAFLDKELFLINADGKMKQKLRYDRLIESVGLIVNEKCLVIQALHLFTFTSEMRFYDF